MELELISPEKQHTISVAWVELNTPKGSYIIQPGHIPMIIPLSPGEPYLFQNKSGKQEIVMVRDGVAHVQRTKVTIVFRNTLSE
jgi:F0F1-type ATP synthase epsilon subunit